MLETLLQASIKNRHAVVFATFVAALFGVAALRKLPIDAVPDITNVQVQISTEFAELSPLDIEKQVTFPIETALAGIPGLASTRSLSRNGFSQVTAVFEDDVDLYFARTQVAERLQAARDALPAGAEPRLGAITTGLGEVVMWTVEFAPERGTNDGGAGWQSDGSYRTPEGERLATTVELASWLRTVQDWIVRPQLATVHGVAGVDSIGGYVKQFHVEPDPMRLVSYGFGFVDVIAALERNNVSTGAGFVEQSGKAYVVRAAGRIERASEIEALVVGTRRGVPVHVHDVATVRIGRELRTGSATSGGEEVVVGTALMLVGANSRTVAAAVEARLAEVRRTLPPGIVVKTVLERTKLVDATIDTVRTNLIEGALLVVALLFLLLGSLPAACIVALAIPLSMLFAATGMVQAGVSGNLMSLGAIDFGLIVDGAVILVENCLRRLAERQGVLGRVLSLRERLGVVARAAKEMAKPSAYGQAIIVTVYVPILALTGVEGRMFHPMAITVLFALLAAFALSLTFVPAMVALFVSGRVREHEGVLMRVAKRAYAPALAWAMHRRVFVMGAAVAVFAGVALLFGRLGQEFVPTLDEHDLALHAMRIPSTSLEQSTEMQKQVERAVASFPEVALVFSKTGTAEMASDPMPPNVSDTFVVLKTRAEWPDPSETKAAFVARLERALEELPGNAYEFTQPIQMRFNELIAGVRSDVAVEVYGDEFAPMRASAEEIADVLRSVPGAADVKVEQTEGLPVMNVVIDRAAIARHGLSMADVQEVVAAAVGGRAAGQVFEGDRRFDLVVRMPEHLRIDTRRWEDLPIPLSVEEAATEDPLARADADPLARLRDDGGAPPAAFLPLGSVAKTVVTEGPNQISRTNGKRRVVVQANVRGRDLGSFVEEAQARVAAVDVPAGGWLRWGGQFENLAAARARLAIVVPLCFVLVFALLVGALRSLRTALFVFSGVPLAVCGGVIALWARGMPFSITAAVGFIALSGVAVLNGLVLVSSIHALRRSGVERDAAITSGSLARLRPVLTTALVASLGFLPMAIATGTGAEVQKPLATVVIGGLVSSTLLTLVVLPALYRAFAGRDPARARATT